MPELSGDAIAALIALVFLPIYALTWQLTRTRSSSAAALMRGCVAALLILPVAGCSSNAPKQDGPADEIRRTLEQEQERQQEKAERAARDVEDAAKDADNRERAAAEEQARREALDKAREVTSQPDVLDTLREESERAEARERVEKEVQEEIEVSRPRPRKREVSPPIQPSPPPAYDVAPPPGTAGGGSGTASDDGLAGGAPSEPEIAAKRADEENADWDVVPVFFGTDRAEEPNPNRLAFSSERGRRLELGRALVTVPKTHEVPQVERPWSIKIPYFDVTIYEEEEDPKRHFTMPEIQKLSKEEFLKLARERLAASLRFKDHAIVFVHGYNTSFDNAVYRTAQISYDLKFDGAAFLYSWPSGGAVASYTYDRESATAAQPYMRQFLDLVVKETGAKSISIIAHSMGNQPLLEVLKDMRSSTPDGVVISQIILAAPDVDADTFSNLTQRISGFAKGITLYAAANDRALTISRNFWQNPRAGDVPASGPVIVPGVDTIDVTGASTDVFALNHSGYAQNTVVLDDIGRLILNGLRPPDQRFDKLKPVTIDRGEFWRYSAQP